MDGVHGSRALANAFGLLRDSCAANARPARHDRMHTGAEQARWCASRNAHATGQRAMASIQDGPALRLYAFELPRPTYSAQAAGGYSSVSKFHGRIQRQRRCVKGAR
jgi:mannosyltransferase OCH1-like enzyme